MKASSATSATAATETQPRTDQLSAPLTPTSAESYALSGPSDLPDPDHHAYRQDLADKSLAGRVIASHYAEPLAKVVIAGSALRPTPSADAEPIREVQPGEPFLLLDDTLGWAWGYAGTERRVGYVPSDVIGAA